MTKPPLTGLRQLCPDVDPRLPAAHLERLGDDYFQAFDLETVARHLRALAALSASQPAQILFDQPSLDRVDVTVLGFDYPGEFSMITGVLAGTGFDIDSGQIFTYAAAREDAASPKPRGGAKALAGDPRLSPTPEVARQGVRDARRRPESPVDVLLRRRCIIDYFSGVLDGRMPFEEWRGTFAARLHRVMALLEDGRPDARADARRLVNELVAAQLGRLKTDSRPILYPVQIEFPRSRGPYTTLRVVSQDTPAFLYALSNALSLQGVSIERVRIKTVHGTVEDEIDVLDTGGRKRLAEDRRKQLRLSVLLTKQFTYFLARAPDPYAALSRFEQLTHDVLDVPDRGEWLDLLSDPRALQDLARILGTSDFIWEDFVRTQYEALRPLLGAGDRGRRASFSRPDIERRLDAALAGAAGFDDIRARLNEWKDREIFLIDLDHILHAAADVRALAEPLTQLAEAVVSRAVAVVYERLSARFGVPCTVGGIPARWAVFGLGKFGGVALGYASDIELLFVYSDAGETNGKESISNAEFFDGLADETSRFIEAKREGIFHVDLRLRPHGSNGPKACGLETFCRYYGPAGESLSFERLALTRLRHVAGDEGFGRQVERLRDGFVYEGRPLDMAELQRLRERQFGDKVKGGRYNAKFSPGALVDLEYEVQVLQVMHGREHPSLRTPRIHEAIAALSEARLLDVEESRRLTSAYYFLRHLINALRMLRGSAIDLYLPASGSDEYAHLARRMGYERQRELDPGRQLYVDFETHTALIRSFIERHFGRQTLTDPTLGNVVDLVLSRDATPEMKQRILTRAGFSNIERAYVNIRRLAGDGARREAFIRIAVLAVDMLRDRADPDMALNNWERFAGMLPDAVAHYDLLLSQPQRLDILLGVFSGSQFLADTLIRYPEFFDWVTNPEILQGARNRVTLAQDLTSFVGESRGAAWLDDIRKFRKRELLRVGTRDICLRAPLEEVTSDLSALAETLVQAALDREWQSAAEILPPGAPGHPANLFCILALGKLGGAELNYSSDIDLLGVYDDSFVGPDADASAMGALYSTIMERLRSALSAHTEEGYVYRVDLRLRPHGTSGHLVPSISAVGRYFEQHAALWEVQALLKARPIAGSLEAGSRLLQRLEPVLRRRRDRRNLAESVRQMREKGLHAEGRDRKRDVKSGLGGIRDIEFLVQFLQLVRVPDDPALWTGNTLRALDLLRQAGAVQEAEAVALRADYIFLRRVEHYLQILEDRQIHEVPNAPAPLTALARRMMGPEASGRDFLARLEETQARTRATYLRMLNP